jgi:multicomponent Na+:H+ antiporter subunit D
MALGVAGEVARQGAVVYMFGGFEPPYGISFRIDALGALFSLLVSGVGAAAAVFSGHSLKAEVLEAKRPLFQAGFLLCLAGLLGMSATGDAFNAFVFLEISSIGVYALIGVGQARDRRALPAAFNYLIMGTIGATFFMLGVGFLYAATGTLNMSDIAARLPAAGDSPVVKAGFALIVVGLGLKAAVFPVHGWLPGAYSHAPSLMNVFLSATGTTTAVYLLVRFVFDVFGLRFGFVGAFLEQVLAPLGAAAAIICSAQAIFQTEIRRMLAFSTVAQLGYVMMAIGAANAEALSAALLHLVAQALIKAALFVGVGGLAMHTPAIFLRSYAGLGRRAPWTAAPLAIAAIAMAGMPLTLGFLSKWRLIEAAVADGSGWMVAVLAIASVLSILYVGRLLELIYFRGPAADGSNLREAPLGALLPAWLLALAIIWFGIDASLPEELTFAAASAAGEAAR